MFLKDFCKKVVSRPEGCNDLMHLLNGTCMLSAEVWAFNNSFYVLMWRVEREKKCICCGHPCQNVMDIILFKGKEY